MNVKTAAKVPNIIGMARTSNWTVGVWLRANGQMMPSQLLLRAIDSDTLQLCHAAGWSVKDVPKATQTDESFVAELGIKLPLIGANVFEPALLLTDGHGSRVQADVANLAHAHSVYIVIIPSHTSMTGDPLDRGQMSLIHKKYSKRYMAMVMSDLDPAMWTLAKKCKTLIQGVNDAAAPSELPTRKGCWEAVGLKDGKLDLTFFHEKVHIYNVGARYRDPTMPKVTQSYLKQLFSPANLSSPPCLGNLGRRPYAITVSQRPDWASYDAFVELNRQSCINTRSISSIVYIYEKNPGDAGVMWRLSIVDWKAGKYQALSDRDELERRALMPQVVDAPRAEFALVNTPVSTAMGTAFYGDNIVRRLTGLEAIQRKKAGEAQQRVADANEARRYEKVIRDTLESLAYLRAEENLTVAHLNGFLSKNGISKATGVTRGDIVSKLRDIFAENGRKAEADRISWTAKDSVTNAQPRPQFKISHRVEAEPQCAVAHVPQPPTHVPVPGGSFADSLTIDNFNPNDISLPDLMIVSRPHPLATLEGADAGLDEFFSTDQPLDGGVPPLGPSLPPGSGQLFRIRLLQPRPISAPSSPKRLRIDQSE